MFEETRSGRQLVPVRILSEGEFRKPFFDFMSGFKKKNPVITLRVKKKDSSVGGRLVVGKLKREFHLKKIASTPTPFTARYVASHGTCPRTPKRRGPSCASADSPLRPHTVTALIKLVSGYGPSWVKDMDVIMGSMPVERLL